MYTKCQLNIHSEGNCQNKYKPRLVSYIKYQILYKYDPKTYCCVCTVHFVYMVKIFAENFISLAINLI